MKAFVCLTLALGTAAQDYTPLPGPPRPGQPGNVLREQGHDYTPLPGPPRPGQPGNVLREQGHDYTPLPGPPRPGHGHHESFPLSAARLLRGAFSVVEPPAAGILKRVNSYVANVFAADAAREGQHRASGLKSKPKPRPADPQPQEDPEASPEDASAENEDLVDPEAPVVGGKPKPKPKGHGHGKHKPGARKLHAGHSHGEGHGHGKPKSKPSPDSSDVEGRHSAGKSKPTPKSKPAPKSKPTPDARPLQGDHFADEGEGSTVYVYPNNPYEAGDYDTLRAEMQLLSTPHAEDYMQSYYMALSTVKGECYVDFVSYCTGLIAADDDDYESVDLGSAVNSVLSFFFGPPPLPVPVPPPHGPDMDGVDAAAAFPPCDLVPDRTFDNSAVGAPDSVNSASSESTEASESLSEGTEGGRKLWGQRDSSSSSSSGSSSSSSSSSSAAEYREQYLAPLGFGESGDICLYSNYEMLTAGCKESIAVVYEIHDQYEEEEDLSHRHGGFAVVLIMLLIVALSLRCCARHCGKGAQKRMAEKSILDVIRSNPLLKAQVEAAAGHTVPEADERKKCCAATCGRWVAAVVIVFVSAWITCGITRDMMRVDDEGYEHGPGPIVIFLIMLAIIVMIISFLRLCQFAYLKYFSSGAGSAEIIATSRDGVQRAMQWSRNLFIRRHPNDYAVLASDEIDESRHGSELVRYAQTQYQPVVVSGVPVAAFPTQQQGVTVVPAQSYPNVMML